MKTKIKLAALFALVILTLSSCGNALHNGTEMVVSKVTLTGLPTDPYTEGLEMLFSYDLGNDVWLHGDEVLREETQYRGTVTADGSIIFTFSPALIILTPTLDFLIREYPNFDDWSKKVSGKIKDMQYANVIFDNTWAGSTVIYEIEGVVTGDDVAWEINEEIGE